MSKQTIKESIAKNLSGRGNQIDISGQLPAILNEMVDETPEPQVQADWNQTDNTKPDYIKNKPTIPPVSQLDGHLYISQEGNEDELHVFYHSDRANENFDIIIPVQEVDTELAIIPEHFHDALFIESDGVNSRKIVMLDWDLAASENGNILLSWGLNSSWPGYFTEVLMKNDIVNVEQEEFLFTLELSSDEDSVVKFHIILEKKS